MAIQSTVLSDDSGVRAMPTAAAAADGMANPTISQMGAELMQFNGTTWDRERGNWNTTTGDTGTKTSSFNGATQINFNARGAFIYLTLGVVSGTSPSLQAQLQWSPDSGTTWLGFGPPSTGLTASNQVVAIFIYPTNLTLAGAAPAALTTGANQTLLINAPLPRTWRLGYTIGGTTPSFVLSNVYVSYIL